MTESLVHVLNRIFQQLFSFTMDHLTTLFFLGVLLATAWHYHPGRVKRGYRWLVLALMLWVQVKVLGLVATQTQSRLTMQLDSPYTTVSAPAGGDTIQYAPSAAFEEITRREQNLTFSDEMFQSIGLQALPGWNGFNNYRPEAVIEVNDKLERTPHATFVRRELVYSYFHPIKFEDSILSLKLDFVPDSVAYKARFEATYRFKNPKAERTKVRFTFPLPDQSGTLSDFRMTVNGKPSEPEWEGELAGGQVVEVKVGYGNYGRRSWTYSPTQQRASISNLQFELESDNSQIKFRRDSLFPTEESSDRWKWILKDVITSQDICVVFPAASKLESISKLLSFSPLALLGFAALLLVLRMADPGRVTLATMAYGAGLVLTSYLCTHLTLLPSTLIGCGLGVCLAGWILGRRARILTLLFLLVPLTFTWPGYTGLALIAGSMACILVLTR